MVAPVKVWNFANIRFYHGCIFVNCLKPFQKYFDVLLEFSKSSQKYWRKKYLLKMFAKNHNFHDNDNAMFPNTREFAFTRQPMKRNFAWSNRAIHSRSSSAFLCRLKFWFSKKIEDEPAYCPHGFQKVVQLFNLMRDYFPMRDSKRLECVKKCF